MKLNNLEEFREALQQVATNNGCSSDKEYLSSGNIEDYFAQKNLLTYQKFHIESSQSDNKNKVHLAYMFSFFEAIAGEHSESVGIHYADMRDKNQTWILNRIALDIKDLPNKYDDITVYTWQSKQSAVGFYREFLVINENNEAIIAARSFWSIMDLNSRTIIPSNEIIANKENPFILPIKTTKAKLKSIKITLPETDNKISYKHLIGYSDLDANNHVNNTRYINMVTNAVDFLNIGLNIEIIEVNYTSELVKGDLVAVEAGILEETDEHYSLAVNIKFLDNLIGTSTREIEYKKQKTHDSFKALIKIRK